MKSAVIFDLDGTLADTLEDIADSMNHVLVDCGFPSHAYESYRFFVGNGLKNLVTQCLPEQARTAPIIDKCYNLMISNYNLNYTNKTRLYEGVSELLDALALNGIKKAILSNKTDLLTQKICSALLHKWNFEAIIGYSERFPRKPNPASALFIAKEMGIEPQKICYLGDSDVDMNTATAAGFYPIGVAWGFRPVEELLKNGAKQIIEHPMELMRLSFL